MIKPTMGLVLAIMSITVGFADYSAARPVFVGHSGSADAACPPDHTALTDIDGDGDDDIAVGPHL